MDPVRLQTYVKDISHPVHTILRWNDTIQDALALLQNQKVDEKIIYFYVIDQKNHLVGVVPTRKLLLSLPGTKVEEVMEQQIIHLFEDQKLEDAFAMFHRHNLLALPVIDKEGKFLGVVDVESCLEGSFDVAKADHREDVFQLMGITLEEKASLWRKYLLRMPWIFCNIFGGILCAFISYHYETVLAKTLLLVLFIPLLLSLSEAISMQTMAQSLYWIRKSQHLSLPFFNRRCKENKLILLMATTAGIFVAVLPLFWQKQWIFSLIIGLSIMLSIFICALLGACLPFFLHRMQLDPKVASGPLVLMLSDVMTLLIYLWVAMSIIS